MTYFSQFPKILYTTDGKSAQLITDFLRRVSTTPYADTNAVIYTEYLIEDGQTPDTVADMIYGDSNLYWIILLTNNIIDPRYDWCMSQYQLMEYTKAKYSNPDAVHHYEKDGLVVDKSPVAFPVSNFQYEDMVNESKRSIRILLPELVAQFKQEFAKEINL